jgi:hypothetical protein
MDIQLEPLFNMIIVFAILLGIGLMIYCKIKNISLRDAWDEFLELIKGGDK